MELKADPDIVRAEVLCQDLETCCEAALQIYLLEREARNSFRQSSSHCDVPSNNNLYRPLNDSEDMRVLELHPGTFEDEICCALHVCSVAFEYGQTHTHSLYQDNKIILDGLYPQAYYAVSHTTGRPIWYTALSYTWGNPAFLKPITCEGKLLYISRDLDCCLRYLRRTDVAVMLWIDQICINQDDLGEKMLQVMLMGRIYQHAWSTLAWLGEESDGSGEAIQLLSTVTDALQYYMDESIPKLEEWERLSLPAPGSQKWSELNKFLSRQWFQRTWIIQEVVLSLDIQLLCGTKCIPWPDITLFAQLMVIHNFVQYLDFHEGAAQDIPESGCLRVAMIDMMKSYHNTTVSKSSLLSVLVQARGSQCTDPRDKVLAVMNMSADRVSADYTSEVFTIYTTAARKTQPSDWVDLLCCVDHAQPTPERPSWVPDWSSPRQTTSLGYSSKYHGVYQAAKGSKPLFDFGENSKSLLVTGIIFDTITFTSTLAEPHLKDLPNNASPTGTFILESMHLAIKNCQDYPSKSGLFDAFWHTLVAGLDASGKSKAPTDFAAVFALLIDSTHGRSPSLPDQPRPNRRLTLDHLKVRRPLRIYQDMQTAFKAAVKGRRFGTTSKRYMGLLPRGAKPGDKICVLSGGPIAFVIRRQGTGASYQLVGECYVNGIMDGEVMQMTDLRMQEIELV